MLSGGSRTNCMIWRMFLGLDLFSTYTDPAEHLITASIGPTVVDDRDDLDVLHRALSEVCVVARK